MHTLGNLKAIRESTLEEQLIKKKVKKLTI